MAARIKVAFASPESRWLSHRPRLQTASDRRPFQAPLHLVSVFCERDPARKERQQAAIRRRQAYKQDVRDGRPVQPPFQKMNVGEVWQTTYRMPARTARAPLRVATWRLLSV